MKEEYKVGHKGQKHATAKQQFDVGVKLTEVFIKNDTVDPEDGRQYGRYRLGWNDMKIGELLGVSPNTVARIRTEVFGFLEEHKVNTISRNAAKASGSTPKASLERLERNLQRLMRALNVEWE
jgi:predicted Ser/Thr protein kinase